MKAWVNGSDTREGIVAKEMHYRNGILHGIL